MLIKIIAFLITRIIIYVKKNIAQIIKTFNYNNLILPRHELKND